MKTLVVFRSYLGTTRQYAEWLAEDIEGELLSFGRVKYKDLKQYDAVVVMSGTYIGWMPLTRFLEAKWKDLQTKKVVVVAVGLAPEASPDSISSYERIPKQIRTKIDYFKIQGRLFGNTSAGEVKRDNLKPVIRLLRHK